MDHQNLLRRKIHLFDGFSPYQIDALKKPKNRPRDVAKKETEKKAKNFAKNLHYCALNL
ncbi:hypothetical protein VINI7043_19663 [Vibrio nigripulchritudo ATCC 27043]|nr:hypothetical protein VINI7043_19663 [Vibrio nigripulchritudo ATCC 27043]